jgi:hypothetical protein
LNLQETRLESAGKEKNFEQKYLEDLKTNFERDSDDFAKALSILDLALEALDEAAGFHGKAMTSFIQSKSSTF